MNSFPQPPNFPLRQLPPNVIHYVICRLNWFIIAALTRSPQKPELQRRIETESKREAFVWRSKSNNYPIERGRFANYDTIFVDLIKSQKYRKLLWELLLSCFLSIKLFGFITHCDRKRCFYAIINTCKPPDFVRHFMFWFCEVSFKMHANFCLKLWDSLTVFDLFALNFWSLMLQACLI